jgi:hypothetical protein
MADNRFEQVDENQPDAITLTLLRWEGAEAAVVNCPANLTGGQLVNDFVSDEMAPVDAFRTAIRLANDIKAPIVVIDPDGLWQAEWGSLYRENF